MLFTAAYLLMTPEMGVCPTRVSGSIRSNKQKCFFIAVLSCLDGSTKIGAVIASRANIFASFGVIVFIHQR